MNEILTYDSYYRCYRLNGGVNFTINQRLFTLMNEIKTCNGYTYPTLVDIELMEWGISNSLTIDYNYNSVYCISFLGYTCATKDIFFFKNDELNNMYISLAHVEYLFPSEMGILYFSLQYITRIFKYG